MIIEPANSCRVHIKTTLAWFPNFLELTEQNVNKSEPNLHWLSIRTSSLRRYLDLSRSCSQWAHRPKLLLHPWCWMFAWQLGVVWCELGFTEHKREVSTTSQDTHLTISLNLRSDTEALAQSAALPVWGCYILRSIRHGQRNINWTKLWVQWRIIPLLG